MLILITDPSRSSDLLWNPSLFHSPLCYAHAELFMSSAKSLFNAQSLFLPLRLRPCDCPSILFECTTDRLSKNEAVMLPSFLLLRSQVSCSSFPRLVLPSSDNIAAHCLLDCGAPFLKLPLSHKCCVLHSVLELDHPQCTLVQNDGPVQANQACPRPH